MIAKKSILAFLLALIATTNVVKGGEAQGILGLMVVDNNGLSPAIEASSDTTFDVITSTSAAAAAEQQSDYDRACNQGISLLYGTGSGVTATCTCDQSNTAVLCSNVTPLQCTGGSCYRYNHQWTFYDDNSNKAGEFKQLNTCIQCTQNCGDFTDRCILVAYNGNDTPVTCGVQRLDNDNICQDCDICQQGQTYGPQLNDCFGLDTDCLADGVYASNPFVGFGGEGNENTFNGCVETKFVKCMPAGCNKGSNLSTTLKACKRINPDRAYVCAGEASDTCANKKGKANGKFCKYVNKGYKKGKITRSSCNNTKKKCGSKKKKAQRYCNP